MAKYDIDVQLIGDDGNAFFMISKTRSALRRNGVTQDEIEEFTKEATSSDYYNVIQTISNWVNIC